MIESDFFRTKDFVQGCDRYLSFFKDDRSGAQGDKSFHVEKGGDNP